MLGAFHFHSTYSHDGTSTLSEIAEALADRGLAFCVMTEHFEDFDAARFAAYLEEIDRITRETGFILIPGMEVHLSGLDTILFPVSNFGHLIEYASGRIERLPGICTVLAHPDRYRREDILIHIARYQIDGIEVWNQQADGCSVPPMELLTWLAGCERTTRHRYFFGCDLHSAKLAVANVLRIEAPEAKTADTVVRALTDDRYSCINLPTKLELRAGIALEQLVQSFRSRRLYGAKVRHSVRRCLRSIYKGLPRATQRSLNDLKNAVRNRI